MSYNSLFGLGSHSEDASLEGWWPLQDNAASTAVVDQSSNGNDGTLVGGDNTADLTTTGPNSWLTAALDLDGSADHIGLGTTLATSGTDWTFLNRLNADVWTNNAAHFSIGNTVNLALITSGGNKLRGSYWDGVTVQSALSGSEYTISAWHSFAYAINTSGGEIYVDGATAGTHFYGNGVAWAAATGRQRTIGAADSGSIGNRVNGKVADTAAFSRRLTAPEIAEWDAGPEPINTVAPALSGTELVGETLTATSGTWALDAPFSGGSNGTVTYSYQWTRSDDDSGTNEADITDATNSTYVLTASDAGKYVRCRVRGTNDGGFDANADTETAFSGAIATTALAANLKARYRLDETSGTVVRNDVRTLLLEPDLSATPGSGTYGDVIDGATEYSLNIGGSDVATSTIENGEWTLHLENNDANATRLGAQWASTLASGGSYVGVLEFTVNALTAAAGIPRLKCDDNFDSNLDLRDYTVGQRYSVPLSFVYDSSTTLTITIESPSVVGQLIDLTIHSIVIYQENAGTYVNSPTLGVPGQVGTAVAFNGTSQYADLGTLALPNADQTISAWVKTTDTSAYVLAERDNSAGGLSMYIGSSGELQAIIGTSIQSVDGGAVNTGEWVHCCIVYDQVAGEIHFYVNGSLIATDDALTGTWATTAKYVIAASHASASSYTNFLDGTLDDVRLWNRALSPTEAKALWLTGYPYRRSSIVQPIVRRPVQPILQ